MFQDVLFIFNDNLFRDSQVYNRWIFTSLIKYLMLVPIIKQLYHLQSTIIFKLELLLDMKLL